MRMCCLLFISKRLPLIDEANGMFRETREGKQYAQIDAKKGTVDVVVVQEP